MTLRRTDRGPAGRQASTARHRFHRGGRGAAARPLCPPPPPHAPRCVELAQTRGGRVLPGFPSGLALNPSCHAGLYPRPGSRVNGRPTRTESGSHVVTMKAMITMAAAVLAGHPHVPVGRWEASWGHHLAAITSIAELADESAMHELACLCAACPDAVQVCSKSRFGSGRAQLRYRTHPLPHLAVHEPGGP